MSFAATHGSGENPDKQVLDHLVFENESGNGIMIDVDNPAYGWHDLTGEITIRGVAVTDPPFQPYIGTNIRQYQFDVNDFVHNSFHILHDQAPSTNLYIHAHWSHNSGSVTTGSVTWEFEIAYAKGHNQAPFAVKTISVSQAASTTQYQHMIAEVAFTSDGGDSTHHDFGLIETDGLLLVATKLTANTMDGSAKPFLHYVDIHYQSTGIPTAGRAPNFHEATVL